MARGHPEALETSAALVTQGIVPVRPVFLTAVEALLEPDGIRELVSDWRTHLRAKNRADSTIDAYLGSVAVLVNDLENEDISVVAPGIGRRELERYFEYLRQRPNSAPESRCRTAISPSSIGTCSSSGVGSTTWKRSLFCRMEVPHVPDNPPTVLREKEFKALLATRKGKGLVELRGGELSLLTVANPAGQERGSFGFDVVRVLGKGRRARDVPFNPATAEAFRRYFRACARHQCGRRTVAASVYRWWLAVLTGSSVSGSVSPTLFGDVAKRRTASWRGPATVVVCPEPLE